MMETVKLICSFILIGGVSVRFVENLIAYDRTKGDKPIELVWHALEILALAVVFRFFMV